MSLSWAETRWRRGRFIIINVQSIIIYYFHVESLARGIGLDIHVNVLLLLHIYIIYMF